ncbi:MAG: phosphatidate cytidylyltransferase, partial [Sulfuritalea sp.]|nr:phosphatidate cytidylyltransferase [Sulfuritalea sp.]
GLYAVAIADAGFWASSNVGSEHGWLFGRSWIFIAAAVFWVVLAPVWLWKRPAFATPAMPLLAGVVVLVPNAAAMVALRDQSPVLLLAVMAIVWISDIAAFFAGHRFGRRKFAPTISPGKTWEGVYGALAAVTVYAIGWIAAAGGSLPMSLRQATLGELWFVLLLLGLAAAGIAGDLLESQMKRQAGVKDSGKVLPGHGGILDRIDALLPVLPLAALLFL